MKIHQIVYSSSANKKILKSDLVIILRKARINNKVSEITGLLMYVDEHFLQILEGDKDKVHELYNKISLDARHKDCQIIYEGDSDKRFFSRWEMAYAAPSSKDLSVWLGLHDTTSVESAIDKIKTAPEYISKVYSNVKINDIGD